MRHDKKIKLVALYTQDPENQKEALLARVRREGWNFDYFEEKETKRKARPVKYNLYQRLLKSEYDAVVIWKLDCWARSLVELITEIDVLYARNVKFVTLMNSIDLTNELAMYQYQTIHDFAEFQRNINATKIKDSFYIDKNGVTRSRKTGKPVGQRGKDKKKRKKVGYYERWSKKTGVVN